METLTWVFDAERRDLAHLFDPSLGYAYGPTLCGLTSRWMWLKQNEKQGAELPKCPACREALERDEAIWDSVQKLTRAEVDEELRREGIDPEKLTARLQAKLAELRRSP
jgi:hypothetical protein